MSDKPDGKKMRNVASREGLGDPVRCIEMQIEEKGDPPKHYVPRSRAIKRDVVDSDALVPFIPKLPPEDMM